MDELIARLEAATEGSGILDIAIATAINQPCEWRPYSPRARTKWLYNTETGKTLIYGEAYVKSYTTSLDAALTLVKEDYRWEISLSERWGFSAFVEPTTGGRFLKDTAPSPALALCIAAFKARSHTAPQEK